MPIILWLLGVPLGLVDRSVALARHLNVTIVIASQKARRRRAFAVFGCAMRVHAQPPQRIGRLLQARIERRRPPQIGDGGIAGAELFLDQSAQAQRAGRVLR